MAGRRASASSGGEAAHDSAPRRTRANTKFGEVWFEPAAVVWHRVSASYGRRPSDRVLAQQSCNEERVFWRNVRGRALVRNLPRHAAVLAGKAVRRLGEGRFVPWAVGRLRAWCGG